MRAGEAIFIGACGVAFIMVMAGLVTIGTNGNSISGWIS